LWRWFVIITSPLELREVFVPALFVISSFNGLGSLAALSSSSPSSQNKQGITLCARMFAATIKD
jgi:hypothetical protein